MVTVKVKFKNVSRKKIMKSEYFNIEHVRMVLIQYKSGLPYFVMYAMATRMRSCTNPVNDDSKIVSCPISRVCSLEPVSQRTL